MNFLNTTFNRMSGHHKKGFLREIKEEFKEVGILSLRELTFRDSNKAKIAFLINYLEEFKRKLELERDQ